MVFLLVALLLVSGVAAEGPVTPACSEVDQFGNSICPDLQPFSNPVVDEQGNNTETASYSSGVSNTFGQVKDLVPAAQGSAAELLEIAGSGIRGSINQTRNAGENAGPRDNETGAGQDSDLLDEKEDSGIKARIAELAEIAGLGLRSSINQTLHADEYPSLTTPGRGITPEPVSDEEEEPAPNILRATYAGIIRNILQFIDITPRAFKGSLRNYSTSNTSIWTNRPADDLIGSPLKAPDTDERFILTLDLPVTRLVKNLTPNPSLLPGTNSTPAVVLPVLPTPTPVPVPVFNLSVDSDPDGALIVPEREPYRHNPLCHDRPGKE